MIYQTCFKQFDKKIVFIKQNSHVIKKTPQLECCKTELITTFSLNFSYPNTYLIVRIATLNKILMYKYPKYLLKYLTTKMLV